MFNYIPIVQKTEDLAVRIIKACFWLNKQNDVTRIISKQLLRSGTSIGANVAESRSAQSNRDFINKLEIALKEARETQYWIRILIKAKMVKPE